VKDDADIQKSLEPVIFYRVDAEKGEGKDLRKQFKVRGYPTFALTNSEGKTIDLWAGYGKEGFISNIGDATKDLSTIDEKQARFKANPDFKDALALGRYNSATGEFKEAVSYYQQAQQLKTDPKVNYFYEIWANTVDGADEEMFAFDDVRKAANDFMAMENRAGWQNLHVYQRMIGLAKQNKRDDLVTRYLQAGLDATANSDDSDMKALHSNLMVEFSLFVKNDTATAVEFKKASMPDGWLNSAGNLNAFAWWCFENKANLNEAEKLSRKSVELAKPGREKAMNFDTLAEILNARGKTTEALEFEKKAVSEDPSDEFFPKQVARFEELLKGKK
jgi:tetratricopeptide (TPR) repeat protein